MKKAISVILFCLTVCALCVGCGKQTEPVTPTQAQGQGMVAIGNPWTQWTTIAEAEAAVGFSFGLPEVIADSYKAASISTMNKEMIQVIYRSGSSEVCIRKQSGEDQDISGDYNSYETCTETALNGAKITTYRNGQNPAVKQLISCNGYSWSLVVDKGDLGDANQAFLNSICGQ